MAHQMLDQEAGANPIESQSPPIPSKPAIGEASSVQTTHEVVRARLEAVYTHADGEWLDHCLAEEGIVRDDPAISVQVVHGAPFRLAIQEIASLRHSSCDLKGDLSIETDTVAIVSPHQKGYLFDVIYLRRWIASF